MRFHSEDHDPEVINVSTKVLVTDGEVRDLSLGTLPLYCLPRADRERILSSMPRFDQCGLLTKGEARREKNPLREGANSLA